MTKIIPFLVLLLTSYFINLKSVSAGGIFGSINNPTKYTSADGQGLFTFLSNVIKLTVTIAGVALIIQLIFAGFTYITAAGDAKKTELAWAKIWQSLIGIIILASAFVIAGVIERFTGLKILKPEIYGP